METHKVEKTNRRLHTAYGSIHQRKDIQFVKLMFIKHLPRLKHNDAV
jgi:hypothetical protein